MYYSVSTSRSKSAPVKDLKLAEQLTEQIKKNPYIPPINLSSVITVPDTKQTDKVQVILMESINKDLFLSDGNYEYNKLGSSFYGTEKELFEVTLLPYIQFPNNPYFTNKYSLGFYNSNYFDGFSVTVEAVAIIKKEITVYE